MAEEIVHKRGDTFEVVGQFTGADYTGWTGRSQVRDFKSDLLLSELEFLWLDPTIGTFRAYVLDTMNWPSDQYVVHDVQLTSPAGVIKSSGLVKIMSARDVTREPASV